MAVAENLRDPLKSAAVIAGVSQQTPQSDLLSLPAVDNNIRDLSRVLRDSNIWGLPADRVTEMRQPTREEFLEAVGTAGALATDTLFVYFAGHGIVHPATDRLYLALSNFSSDGEFGTKAVRYADLQDLLWEPRIKARHKVIVLDTCFSATAFDDAMGMNAIYQMLRTRGACTLVSSDVTETSRAPQGTDYTSYTARLISTLQYGIKGEESTLTLQALHQRVRDRLLTANISTPRILGVDDTPLIRIARNRAYQPGTGDDHDDGPSPGERQHDFQDELHRLLEAELKGQPAVRVGRSLAWDARLGAKNDGERLLALIEHRGLLENRITAFTTHAVKFNTVRNNGPAQVSYPDMVRWSVKTTTAHPVWEWWKEGARQWYGYSQYTLSPVKLNVFLSCDDTSYHVPHGDLPDRLFRAVLEKVRDLTRKYQLDGN
ncbi:caspase family protein [Streptomyces sp. Tue 6075]|uniref:caspase family protein n=1 Tax=Streptomyces sp. Tue 6075 TaxID=1661694 RepID=UPI00094A9B7C|nr:caspase family protein [Streptomyces sp. Tue 6075]